MPHYQQILRIPTQGKSFSKITAKVQEAIAQSQIQTGLCTLFLRHTSASLVIQENADPDVLQDLVLCKLSYYGLEGWEIKPDFLVMTLEFVTRSLQRELPVDLDALLMAFCDQRQDLLL